jgi:hypothetical protein
MLHPEVVHMLGWGESGSPLGMSATVWRIARALNVGSNRCNENWQGKPKYSEETFPKCHFVHHKSHMNWPGLEPKAQLWKSSY